MPRVRRAAITFVDPCQNLDKMIGSGVTSTERFLWVWQVGAKIVEDVRNLPPVLMEEDS